MDLYEFSSVGHDRRPRRLSTDMTVVEGNYIKKLKRYKPQYFTEYNMLDDDRSCHVKQARLRRATRIWSETMFRKNVIGSDMMVGHNICYLTRCRSFFRGYIMYVQLCLSFVDASALNFPACPDGERIFTDSDGIVIDTKIIPCVVPLIIFPPFLMRAINWRICSERLDTIEGVQP